MSEPQSTVPALRVRPVNDSAVAGGGDYVLYWMIAQRRTTWSFAMDRAVDWARELGKPLLVFEALRCGYRWASDRMHRFVLQGMADNRHRLEGTAAGYYPYVEPQEGHGSGLLEALAERAAVVVTDDFPCFFLPRMVAAAGKRLEVKLEAVDSNGLLPLASSERTFFRAVDFRRHLQKHLPEHLGDRPRAFPLRGSSLPALEGVPAKVLKRWPAADLEALTGGGDALKALPIDHCVAPVATSGGQRAAEAALERFLADRLERYVDGRRDVCDRATSELSPYLHFGHISAHQVFHEIVRQEDWNPGRLASKANGSRSGWWGMSEAAESYLDELITWRELGYNFTHQVEGYDRYESLPRWARATLAEHRSDPREHVYSLEELEAAATHDEIWNAAQRELLRTGRIHNYLRMLWGKKILEWTAEPESALEVMIELNNKYAVDGRNPNSYSGIFWCLGRFDRAWGPERPIFGKIRYMSSDSTRRKLDAKAYLADFGPQKRLPGTP